MGSIVYNYEDIAKRVLGDDWFPKKPAAMVEPLKAIVAPASIEQLLRMSESEFSSYIISGIDDATLQMMTRMSAEELIRMRCFVEGSEP